MIIFLGSCLLVIRSVVYRALRLLHWLVIVCMGAVGGGRFIGGFVFVYFVEGRELLRFGCYVNVT